MQHKKRALRTVLLLRNTLAVIAVVLAVAVAVVSWRLLFASAGQTEQADNLSTVTTTEQDSQGTPSTADPASPGSTTEQEDADNSDLPQDEDSQERFPFLPEGSTLPDVGTTQEDGSALPSEKDPMAPPAEGGQIL